MSLLDPAELINALGFVGYTGQLLHPNTLKKSLDVGLKCVEFRKAIVWLANEIRALGELEEQVQQDEDINTFVLELSGFLKELQCPHNELVIGHVSDRFQTIDSKMKLLDFLVTELMSYKMYIVNKPKDTSNVITIYETPTAAALKDLVISLNMGKPPENIATKTLFERIDKRLDEVIRIAGPKRLGKALFNPTKSLTDEQWKSLKTIRKGLEDEYNVRRKTMLTRLDVTIQSFQWSDRLKGRGDDIAKEFTQRRQRLEELLKGGEDTNISALLAARNHLAIIEKTSNSSVRKFTKSKVQRHIIGQVPDRGGRAHEHVPPPPEMPPWAKRDGGRGGGFGGGGGGRGGRGGGFGDRGNRGGGGFNQQKSHGGIDGGGYQQKNYQQNQTSPNYQNTSGGGFDNRGGGNRVQGGWSQKGSNYQDSGYSSRTDNYNDNRGGYQQQNTGGGGGFHQQQTGNSGGSYQQSQGGNGGRGGYQHQGGQSHHRGGSGGGGGGGRGGRSNYNRGGGGGGGGNRY